MKAYARYTVKVSSFKGGKRFDVLDNYWDSSNYAFTKADGTIYSHNDVAAKAVASVLNMAPSFKKNAKPGRCYQIVVDGPFGGFVEVKEVPASWYRR